MSLVALTAFLTASLFGAEALGVTARHDDSSMPMIRTEKQATARYKRLVRGIVEKDVNESSTTPTDVTQTVNIHLFYETRCPDCIEFINGTLAPLWRNKEMNSLIDVTLNPYGNAESLPVTKVSEGYKYWHPVTTAGNWSYVHICQHGNEECLGNLIQTCAQNFATQDQQMEFIFCMAERPNWGVEKASYECMQKNGIDHNLVKDCVESPEGNQLFADFGKITAAVPDRKGTPWVLINGATLDNPTDLLKTVCGHVMVQEKGPSSCEPFSKKASAAEPNQEAGDDFTVLTAQKKKPRRFDYYFDLSRDHI